VSNLGSVLSTRFVVRRARRLRAPRKELGNAHLDPHGATKRRHTVMDALDELRIAEGEVARTRGLELRVSGYLAIPGRASANRRALRPADELDAEKSTTHH
jgi:hypothetical protein